MATKTTSATKDQAAAHGRARADESAEPKRPADLEERLLVALNHSRGCPGAEEKGGRLEVFETIAGTRGAATVVVARCIECGGQIDSEELS